MVKKSIKVSIVIPAYNEQGSFEAGLLTPMVDFLASQSFPFEVVFVDDGSTDKTKKLLSEFSKKLSRPNKIYRTMTIQHGGKAAAVRAGVLDSRGSIILFTDFDQSTPITPLLKFIKAHEEGADVVIGVRGGDKETKDDTLIRKIRSKAFVTLVQIVAIPGIKDSQCGFKSFKREVAHRIFKNLKITFGQKVSGGYMGAFDVEALFIAKKLGCRIDQIPVPWIKIYSPRLNIWKEPLQMAIDTFKIRFADLSGKYNAI